MNESFILRLDNQMKLSNIIHLMIKKEFQGIFINGEMEVFVDRVMSRLNISKSEISILLINDQQIKKFNQKYRGIDTSTDVLSFLINEFNPETGLIMLGDILISVPTAKIQAESNGVGLDDEIHLLIVHGVLHLVGYDHRNDVEKNKMFLLQSQLLQEAV